MFFATLSGLEASTTYYYRAVVEEYDESLGAFVDKAGSIQSFTTKAAQPAFYRPYLENYEIPAFAVVSYTEGEETHGSTSYYSYTTPSSDQKLVVHTFSYSGVKRNYSLLYDRTKCAALWVAYAMNTDSYPWIVDRSNTWKADPGIPSNWQPDLSSGYKESTTYSRGHQCASNDRRTTDDQTKQTNYYSNMTPQLSGFNGGVWETLEGDIQKIGKATSGSDTLYVVTGPVFGAGYGTTQDKNNKECAVPTQYFKCIMKVHFSGNTPQSAEGAAYLLDHESGATRQNVSINEIEELTGFDFFTNIPVQLQSTAEAETHLTSYFPQQN